MATVDKLTLELDADGVEKFIRSMNDAESKLKSIQDSFIKTAKEKGLMDDKLEKTNKKKDKKRKKNDKNKNSAVDKFNKNLKKGAKTLDTMLKTLLAISAISFGLSGLMSKSELAAKTGTDLANQARNINASPKDLEAINTALRMGGVGEGALNDLINKLSDNQSRYKAGLGSNPEIQQLIAALNGYDRSGKKIDAVNTDPVNTIKSIAIMLQSNDEYTRKSMIGMLGLDGDVGNFLSNKRVFDFLNVGQRSAIQTEDRADGAQRRNAAIVGADKALENQWTVLGESFTPIRIKLTQLATKILEEVNKMTPQIEESMPALSKIADIILEWTKIILEKLKGLGVVSDNENADTSKTKFLNEYLSKNKSLKPGEIDVIKNRDADIQDIDAENGELMLSKGRKYKKGGGSMFPSYLENYFDYVISEYQKNGANPQLEQPQTGQQLMQQNYSNQSMSSNQVISIQEMIINTSSSNISDIVNDGMSNSKLIVGNPASMYPHLSNTR
ncbi:hypothetical protein DES39_0555 [Orbus hercynius]|uniref:Uncharacterized protein n=1 Tax=Orbus hercynius TaxID=593135 RepID=A0A495RJ67_9GAMM|nr:hypothetical protein [Orbus hercynius]RKS87334.1 hypothetical protein DES39_0555 [Orbus hercynius]